MINEKTHEFDVYVVANVEGNVVVDFGLDYAKRMADEAGHNDVETARLLIPYEAHEIAEFIKAVHEFHEWSYTDLASLCFQLGAGGKITDESPNLNVTVDLMKLLGSIRGVKE